MPDTYFNTASGTDAHKLVSSDFTSTIKDSVNWFVTLGTTGLWGMTWDGEDTGACSSSSDRLYRYSGSMTTTVKSSVLVNSIDTQPCAISFSINDTYWNGRTGKILYIQSGKVTSTVKTSLDILTAIGEQEPFAVSPDLNLDTLTGGFTLQDLILMSGSFTSTVKTSVAAPRVIAGGGVSAISWYDDETIYANDASGGGAVDHLVRVSGKFTTTVHDSLNVAVLFGSTSTLGIETENFAGRMTAGGVGGGMFKSIFDNDLI